MKSEKAKEMIEKYAPGNSRDAAPQMLKKTCILCVELAEQEAEERMREELTRWRDPKDIMPEPGKKVLVKCISGEIQTDFYEPELDGFFIEHATYAKVIGWRDILENE